MRKSGILHPRASIMLVVCVLSILFSLGGCAMQAAAPAQEPAPSATPAPTPEPTEDCGIPDLQYETEAYALDTLRSRGVVAVIEYEENGSVLPGLVESQSVEAGVCVQNGQPVKLKIAKALPTATPEPTPKPRKNSEADEELLLDAPQPSELEKAPSNVVYVDGIAVTPQPTWAPNTFQEPDPGTERASCG